MITEVKNCRLCGNISIPFKFRIWDKKLLKFDYNYYIGFDHKNNKQVITNGYGDYIYNDFIIQQFTGLKDTNGSEIFVGDFVKITGVSMEYHFMFGEVKFGEYDCIHSKCYEKYVEYGFFVSGLHGNYSLIDKRFSYVVIGNVYLNNNQINE